LKMANNVRGGIVSVRRDVKPSPGQRGFWPESRQREGVSSGAGAVIALLVRERRRDKVQERLSRWQMKGAQVHV
jgi:hypothetical protein